MNQDEITRFVLEVLKGIIRKKEVEGGQYAIRH